MKVCEISGPKNKLKFFSIVKTNMTDHQDQYDYQKTLWRTKKYFQMYFQNTSIIRMVFWKQVTMEKTYEIWAALTKMDSSSMTLRCQQLETKWTFFARLASEFRTTKTGLLWPVSKTNSWGTQYFYSDTVHTKYNFIKLRACLITLLLSTSKINALFRSSMKPTLFQKDVRLTKAMEVMADDQNDNQHCCRQKMLHYPTTSLEMVQAGKEWIPLLN